MKKFIAILLLALVALAAVSAEDFIVGKWLDEKWDGLWNLNVTDSGFTGILTKNGEKVFEFTKDNCPDWKVTPGLKGVTLTFSCKETERSYSFTKPLTLNADLDMTVTPDWNQSAYTTTIKFQK